jgi:hypothetical protein
LKWSMSIIATFRDVRKRCSRMRPKANVLTVDLHWFYPSHARRRTVPG